MNFVPRARFSQPRRARYSRAAAINFPVQPEDRFGSAERDAIRVAPWRGAGEMGARLRAAMVFCLFCTALFGRAFAQELPVFDFTKEAEAKAWGAPHDISRLEPASDGLVVHISGEDPYFFGPARDYPPGQPLWMRIQLKSETGGAAQIFYFTGGPSEGNSVHFHVDGGGWEEARVRLPALRPGTRLRIDPPGTSGTCTIKKITFEPRAQLKEPAWPQPIAPNLKNAPTLLYGDISLTHGRGSLGALELRVKGALAAVGNTHGTLGYTIGSEQRWLTLTNPVTVLAGPKELIVRGSATDPDGGKWDFSQTFRTGSIPNAIDFESSATCSSERQVIFLPMITLLPGVDSFGTNKTQGLFAGLEYLENEPSSSEADVIGPGSHRRVPDPLKVTFPLMVIASKTNYVGLVWQQQPRFAALYDSPDRIFKSGGHLLSLIFPGAAPDLREDGSVLPYGGETLQAGRSLVVQGTILAGSGSTVIPAIQQYIAGRGLPPQPNTGYDQQQFVNLEAHGWLDSRIRDGAKFRHAVGGSFGSSPAADAALYMDWLAGKVADANLASRLTVAAREAIALVPAPAYNSAGVGHVRFPVEALVYGHVAENAVTALNEGRGQLGGFKPDGSIEYHPPAQGNDLSRTHWSREANGLTATHVTAVLERAAFSGDPELIKEGLRLLHAMDKFRDTVPRGAQTWEVPLHTPDILASAYLVRAYTLGYELSGEKKFLDQARDWAWTGLPFVYLTPPNDKPVGVYSTIPVFGATQFVAPNWIGLPVQWCGLVYGNAIRRFAVHDPKGPWLALADGIARAGLQHTHPLSDIKYQGLLPDSFELRHQVRNPVPINPATLAPEAIAMEGFPPIYSFRACPRSKLLIHAPGSITEIDDGSNKLVFKVAGWPRNPWYVLINGLKAAPTVRLNGADTPVQAPHQFQDGRLILQVSAAAKIELLFGSEGR